MDDLRRLAAVVMLGYAVLMIAGGIAGWRLSGSRASFTSGLASAALLAVAYRISLRSPAAGTLMAAVICFALAAFFAVRLGKTKKMMPAGMLLLLSAAAGAILGWITLQTG
jgi:uncharacterized membrane protein (UPF0136 family)